MNETITTAQDLIGKYSHFRNKDVKGRYITYNHIKKSLDLLGNKFPSSIVGTSTKGRPIHLLGFGKGKIKILAWSQMHGNESTTTKAIFDVFNAFRLFPDVPLINLLEEHIDLRVIPMLNPDGAVAYTRVNANKVDLNRDAFMQREEESKVLRKVFEDFQPHYCFNLHDQRTIFSAGEAPVPATISFLTPAMDDDRSVTPSRRQSMKVIVAMNEVLQDIIPNGVGRYSDDYNINCTGDTFQTQGIPTILFEAGHFPGDYHREKTRELVAISILKALEVIATSSVEEFDPNHYFEIPQNEKLFYDLILRNALIEGKIQDVAVQFKEELESEKIKFIPIVEKIGPGLAFYGHREMDCAEKELKTIESQPLRENVVAHNLLLKNEVLIIKYANN